MLLPLRWLFYQGTTTTAEREAFTSKRREVQRELRKLRRLTRWTEAVAPPRIQVEVETDFVLQLVPEIRTGVVVTTKHIAVYSKGFVQTDTLLAPFVGIDVSVNVPEIAIKSAVFPGEIETKIDLLEEEIAALIAALQ